MIKRPTWILLGLLLLVVAAYAGLKKWPIKSGQTTPTATPQGYLMTAADGTLTVLQITDNTGHTFRMQRNSQNNWVIILPQTGDADQSLAAAAETQAKALQITTDLQTPTDLGTFGLASPADMIDLGFSTGAQHKIEVGAVTPTNSGYYVRFDGKYYVVNKYGLDALLKLLTEPPYPATPTPAVTEPPTPEAPSATP